MVTSIQASQAKEKRELLELYGNVELNIDCSFNLASQGSKVQLESWGSLWDNAKPHCQAKQCIYSLHWDYLSSQVLFAEALVWKEEVSFPLIHSFCQLSHQRKTHEHNALLSKAHSALCVKRSRCTCHKAKRVSVGRERWNKRVKRQSSKFIKIRPFGFCFFSFSFLYKVLQWPFPVAKANTLTSKQTLRTG